MININITTKPDGEDFDVNLSGAVLAPKVEIYSMLYTLFNSLSILLDTSIEELYGDFGEYLIFKVTQDEMKRRRES